VGRWYNDFHQVSDTEVQSHLFRNALVGV